MNVMTIEQMRKYKRELGYTNEMIAEKSGVPLGTVQKVFSGATKAPRRGTLEAISRVLTEEKAELGYDNRGFAIQSTEKNTGSVRIVSEPMAVYGRKKEDTVSEEHSRLSGLAGRYRQTLSGFRREREGEHTEGEYTKEDYYALPDEWRAELIDGTFYDMASPGKLHQGVLLGISVQLDQCMEGNRDTCFLYLAPCDVELGEDGRTVVQPDLYIHCDRDKETNEPHHGAPDFILEVMSPSNPQHDLWTKQGLYKRHGVREYWIVDPVGKKVLVFDFENALLPTSYTFDETVPVLISQGKCHVDFTKVYERVKHLYT